MDTPKSIQEHEADYKPDAWKTYTLQELGAWVHLLTKRAEHRSEKAKASKDLSDAQNYLDMMGAIVDDAKTRLL